MKQYKKPEVMSTEVLMQQNLLTGSPKAYGEEGNGTQLTRKQLWADEEE